MPEPSSGGPTELARRIGDEIRARGPIPFARFMDRALYEPGQGYYARSASPLGPTGDFFTASDVGTAFGECVARQWIEMDRALGAPDPFSAVEIGAGRGLLARDALDTLAVEAPGLRARIRCLLADASAAMRAEAATNAPEACVVDPGAIGSDHVGCVIAVELFDALPVHRVRRRGSRLREVFVDVGPDGSLIEVEREPLPVAQELALRYGAAPRDGDESEVCPAAVEQVDRIAAVLARGFAIVVDYGHRAAELYGSSHNRGTLLAYRGHATSEAYLERVGEQDLTAHVNFSLVEDRARERGMDVLGLTTQDRFLIANGILARFEEGDPALWGDPARVRRRLHAMQLIHPQGMGRVFRVLVLAKGFERPPRLAGLVDPFGR